MQVEAKICGLCRREDARAAAEAGAHYLGVVFAPGARRRTLEQARVIFDDLAPRRVGVFVDAELPELLKVATALELDTVQLHGSEDPEYCARIREAGAWAVWKAVRIRNEADLPEALARYPGCVDGLLLEGHSERGHGGVGARFRWALARQARARWPAGLRLILAGGLDPGNVAEAIESVRPDVVDVSSGVEREVGRKDRRAIRAFLEAVSGARV